MGTKRILVTGASGFVGQPLVRALVRAGYAVRAASRRPVSFANSVDVVTVPDFNDPVDWEPILRGMDIVVHLAGHAHADKPDSTYAKSRQCRRPLTSSFTQLRAQVLNAFCSFLRSAPKPVLQPSMWSRNRTNPLRPIPTAVRN